MQSSATYLLWIDLFEYLKTSEMANMWITRKNNSYKTYINSSLARAMNYFSSLGDIKHTIKYNLTTDVTVSWAVFDTWPSSSLASPICLLKAVVSPAHKLLEIFWEVARFQESCQFIFQPHPYKLNDKLLDKFWTKMNAFVKILLKPGFHIIVSVVGIFFVVWSQLGTIQTILRIVGFNMIVNVVRVCRNNIKKKIRKEA